MHHRRANVPIALACLLASTLTVAAPTAASTTASDAVDAMTPDVVDRYDEVRPEADYIRRTAMIAMRDGVKLYTVIVMRKGTHGGPILLSRTPYDAQRATSRTRSQRIVDIVPVADAEFVEDGYIRVFQDIRGLHRSEGAFVMTRPIAGPLNPTGIDESTDAYDTIAWLVKNVPESNGKVGIVGSSYLGFTTLMAEIDPHPALKAAAPESPMVDTWIGDDAFHNGAFRVNMLDYAVWISTGKADADAEIPRGGRDDDYATYLDAGSIGDFARQWGVDRFPYARKLMAHPAYTDYWSQQAVDQWLAARPLAVPTLLEVGQWDQEDSYGAPAVYRALKPKDKDGIVSLVIGPWRHSGANHDGDELGALSFAGDTAREFRVRTLKPFFDHYLKGAPDPHTPPVLTYATGANRWEASPHWPMGVPTPLYLHAGFTAGFERPADEGHDDYVSDPAHPVPFLPRPIHIDASSEWTTWLVHDQRFVSDRPDVVHYETAPLERAVHIMGAPRADLFAATSGTDSDWVVKLIDVQPHDVPEADQGARHGMDGGYELPIGIEIFRGRYVHGFATPAPLTPGKPQDYRFDLPNVDHVFLPGHRIMVEIQSSLFPLYDRNPQTYVPNIFDARPQDYRAATQSIWRGGARASAVLLPIVDDATGAGAPGSANRRVAE